MTSTIPARGVRFDWVLFIITVALLCFGVVMVYSASAIVAFKRFGNPEHFVIRQAIYGLVGLGAMAFAIVVDYRWYKAMVNPLLAIVTVGLLVCLSPWGSEVNGAARWIRFGPLTVQPGELAKVALVLWLSYSLAKKKEKIKTFSIGFLPHLVIPGVLILLCMMQPDFGTAVLIASVTFVLLFVAGAKAGYIFLALLLAAPVGYLMVSRSEYRMRRWMSFLDPFAYRDNEGYQLIQSWYGFATGGLTGVGLGDGRGKVYLPEAYNDFVVSVIGEELGVFGVFLVLAAFAIIVVRGMRISFKANDDFGAFVAVGLTVLIGLQVLANMGVATGLLPTKGLNLPLVSYGGSALVVTLFSVGILLNISKCGEFTRTPERRKKGKNQKRSDSDEENSNDD